MTDILDDLDALADAHLAAQAMTAYKKPIPPGVNVRPGHWRKQFDWQISINYNLVLYCKVCFWGSSNEQYKYCPYTHGAMAPIADYYAELLDDV